MTVSTKTQQESPRVHSQTHNPIMQKTNMVTQPYSQSECITRKSQKNIHMAKRQITMGMTCLKHYRLVNILNTEIQS